MLRTPTFREARQDLLEKNAGFIFLATILTTLCQNWPCGPWKRRCEGRLPARGRGDGAAERRGGEEGGVARRIGGPLLLLRYFGMRDE